MVQPQAALWRERFRQKCAERAESDRVKYRNAARSRSGIGDSNAATSEDAMSDDIDVEDRDGGDTMDDPVSTSPATQDIAYTRLTNALTQALQCLYGL